jgi:hypothetical protein
MNTSRSWCGMASAFTSRPARCWRRPSGIVRTPRVQHLHPDGRPRPAVDDPMSRMDPLVRAGIRYNARGAPIAYPDSHDPLPRDIAVADDPPSGKRFRCASPGVASRSSTSRSRPARSERGHPEMAAALKEIHDATAGATSISSMRSCRRSMPPRSRPICRPRPCSRSSAAANDQRGANGQTAIDQNCAGHTLARSPICRQANGSEIDGVGSRICSPARSSTSSRRARAVRWVRKLRAVPAALYRGDDSASRTNSLAATSPSTNYFGFAVRCPRRGSSWAPARKRSPIASPRSSTGCGWRR